MVKMLYGLIISLIFLCVSCAGVSSKKEIAEPTQLKNDQVVAPVDRGCAYSFFLKGRADEHAGKFDEALENYKKALACDENADYIRNHLAMLFSRTGRKKQALLLMEEVVARNPEDIDSKGLLAGLYAHTGEIAKAITIYKNLLKLQPENQNIMLMLGTLYARQEKYSDAQKVFESLVENEPESYVGHYYLARLYREMQLFEKASQSYEKALALNWSVVLSFEIAEFYEQQQQIGKAITVYKRTIEQDPSNEEARRKIASLYLQSDKIDEALKELRELRKITSEKEKIDLIIGRVMLQHKRYNDAIAHFTGLLEGNQELDTARYLLAIAHHELGQNKKSAALLQEMPLASKRYEEAILFLASIYRDEKNYEDLEKLLLDNINNDQSRKVSFYVTLAALYENQGETEKAKEVFQDAFKAFPDDAKVYFEYGLFLDGMGDQDGAIASMEKVLEINPDDPFALNYVGYTWADNNMNLEKALQYIEKAIELRPDDGFIRDSLGWVYFRLGYTDRAIKELKKAVAINTKDPAIYEHLGDAYTKNGQKTKALEAYERAFQLYQDEEKKESIKHKIEKLGR